MRRRTTTAGAVALGGCLLVFAVDAQRRRPRAPPVSDPLPTYPDRATVIRTLRNLETALQRCTAERDVASLTITFRGDGGPTALLLPGRRMRIYVENLAEHADERPEGSPAPPPLSAAWLACAVSIVREVRVPRFREPTFRVSYAFRLRFNQAAEPERPR